MNHFLDGVVPLGGLFNVAVVNLVEVLRLLGIVHQLPVQHFVVLVRQILYQGQLGEWQGFCRLNCEIRIFISEADHDLEQNKFKFLPVAVVFGRVMHT